MIDDLFNLIINKSEAIQNEFYELLEKLDFNYTKDMIDTLNIENLQDIKDIIYTLYELFTLYKVSKTFKPENLIPYFKKTVINNYKN